MLVACYYNEKCFNNFYLYLPGIILIWRYEFFLSITACVLFAVTITAVCNETLILNFLRNYLSSCSRHKVKFSFYLNVCYV